MALAVQLSDEVGGQPVEAKPNLIYDLGLHKGEDTDFYLRKGFDVVAVEADPELVDYCRVRFQVAISQGKLLIIEGAIAPASAGDKITFYRNPGKTVWGTITEQWVERNAKSGHGSEMLEVARIDIADLYRSYGIPFYLKTDIEGVDVLVLNELQKFTGRPKYLSLESEKVDFSKLEAEIVLLQNLGYKKFKLVQQGSIPGTKIKSPTLDSAEFDYVFEKHASGPFGEEALAPWLSADEALQDYRRIFRQYHLFGDYSRVSKLPWTTQKWIRMLYRLFTGHRGPLPGWYDTHATL